jgi:uracil-DNA glycosylase
MMAKIVTAMHETPESAPIVFNGERPPAKMYVVLGSEAMKKWYPGMHGAPGQWLRGRNGEDVLLTYSPEYLLRFGAATPALMKLKREMWTSLKGVMQRIGH